MCFGCSKEPSHRDGSFEYPLHMFWLRNKKMRNSLAGSQTDLVMLDFSKAFDNVSHPKFLLKLHRYGLSLKWIQMFLSGRSQT